MVFPAMRVGIVTNMAVVEQSAYENFRPGTEVDAMDMEEKIKGAHLRGKKYTVSQNGLCPRCGNSNRLYVILDKLFPMGDMPEILHTLMARGRAILWSSQEKEGYKDPPTFLCRGFCPSDPLGAGFNVNWGSVSVNEILESLDKPLQAINPVSSPQGTHIQGEESSQDESSDNPYLVLDDFQRNESEIERNTSQTSVIQSSSDKEEENDEEEDEDDDELDEEELIKQMLAKEQQKLSQENKDDNDEEEDDNDDDDGNVHQDVSAAPTVSEDFSDQSALSNKEASSTAPTTASTEQMASSSTTKKSAASTAEQYPVSSTGHCPYCGSTDVKYIIVVSENTQDSDLPATLQQLLKSNHAFKMAKGNSEPPSFQCQKCQYGFNLNWSKTNLEIIFGLPPATSAPTTPAASYTSTASMAYQTPPVAYTPYRGPSVPPPGYPPTVRVPPPVPTVSYQSYPPTYPGYYGSYYPSPPLPSAAGLYPPYSPPGIPPPGIPYPGVPPPGIPPPGIPPPRVPPPAIPPPRVPPPAVPPPMLPPPGIPSPGISPPGIPPPRLPTPSIPPAGYPPPAVPSRAAHPWGIYPQSQPVQPHFPTPLARRYPPPPGGRPYYPPLQQVRPPRPSTPRTFYQAAAHAAVSATTEAVPTQQVISAQQDAGGKNNGVAAARFEMVLNQIDLAKARVRHEKEQMKEFQKAVHGNEMCYQEPNAVTEDELRPPGDEDTGFDYNIIIPGSSLEQEQVTLESAVTPDTAEHSVLPPQVTAPAVSEHPKEATAPDSDAETPDQSDVTARETEAGVRDVVESSVVEADDNSNKDQNADDDGAVPEVVEAAPKTAVATRGGRSGRSKKQEKLPSPPTATSTRQTRRSRRSEPAATTEDTDSTAAEEEAVAVTGRSRRSRKTKPLSKEVERMDIRDEQEEGLEATDVEMGESSDVLSQSSVVPQTESDSTQEAISESLPSSSEPDTVFPNVARPQRGRQTRGRKRKQEAAVAEASFRKSRRMVAEEQLSEDKNEDEDIVVENSTVVNENEDTEIAATSLRVGRSRRGASGRQVKPQLEAVDTTEESNTEQEEHESTAVTQLFDKQNAKMRTQRQTRKSAHLPEEAEAIAAGDSITSPQTKATSVTTHEEGSSEAEETTKNRRARRSAPISLETDEGVGNRRKRKSAQLSSQESELSDTELQVNSDDVPKIDAQEVKSKATVFQQEEKKMQSDASPADHEEKPSRWTRKTRKSSEGDDASGPQEVLLSLESDSLIPTEEAVGNRQTRSRKSPTVRSKVQTIESNTSAVEETKRTTGKRKSRKSLGSNEDTTNDDVELSVEPATPEEVVSSRQRKRRNKSNPSVQENTELSQASDDLSGEHDVEEEAAVAPQRKVAKKMAPVQSPETVTKRVTRARQRK